MRSLRWALAFIGVAGLVCALLLVSVVAHTKQDYSQTNAVVLTVLPSLSFIATGLFAWYRRPENRCGPLMTATGFAWFLVPLALANSPWLYVLGLSFSNTVWILLAALLLVFPTGRLEARWHRWVLAVLVLDAVVLSVAQVLLGGPQIKADSCPECPRNPLAIADYPGVCDVLSPISAFGGVLLIGLVIFIVARRFRGFETANRVAIRPLLAAGSATIALLAVTLLSDNLGAPQSVSQAFFLATGLALATVPVAFLVGLLRSRITGAEAVGRLVETLGEGGEAELDVEAALAQALGDPGLRLLYWLPERAIYADAAGSPVELPANGGLRVTPIEHNGELIAAVVCDEAIVEDERLVGAAGSAAALALRNRRLAVELRASVEELRASRARIVQSSDSARRTLERNLHDGAQQHLVSMAVTLRLAREKLDADPEAARELLERASIDLDSATRELRELARGIHPAILTDRGLGPALDALAGRASVPVALDIDDSGRLPQAVESAAYFVAAEALTNTARYAEAERASVSVSRSEESATIEIVDDGIGGADIGSGSGLSGLQDRVAALGGVLTVVSPRGEGTRVKAVFPCGS